jgi:multidrug resistance efflux pump
MLKSELEGHTTIQSVVEEGTKVEGNFEYTIKEGDTLASMAAEHGKDELNIKALNEDYEEINWDDLEAGQQITLPGDLLLELDPLDLKRRINQMEITVQKSENALHRLQGNQKTTKLSATLALKVAENTHKLAVMDKDKAVNSTIKNQIKDFRGSITNLINRMAISEAKLKWYRQLEEKQFLASMTLRDEEQKIAEFRHQIEMAQANLDAYLKYDQVSMLSLRELAVDESMVNIEKTKVSNTANLNDANASISTQQKTLALEYEALADFREQMANTRIYAPEPGTVVYYAPHHWERQEPVADGSNVRRGQKLIKLPKDKSLKVDLSIPQSMRAQLKRGMRAWVQVENGEPLPGTLSVLSTTVDTNRRGHTQKSYFKGEITIDKAEFPDSVSEGMMVTVEIQVVNLIGENQRIKVPNQCVTTKMLSEDLAETGCWVLDPRTGKPDWRPVTIEYSDENFIAIKEETIAGRGLREGELIHLSPLTQADTLADSLNLEEGVTDKGKVTLGPPVPKEQLEKEDELKKEKDKAEKSKKSSKQRAAQSGD